jgi:muramoyltetrapeptide carboxypeptidase LdcA involved in peptidoglycan recycling
MSSNESLRLPPKLQRGDQVAILSPSWAGAGVFPAVHERGLRVVREELGLVPVEFPTTRQVGASPRERARDISAAFADPEIKALMAVIGGSDQITVLPHLDFEVIADNPKAFFGYSDNTNLLNYLWRAGIASYHGGSTLVHLARPGGVHSVFLASLRHALFDHESVEILPLESFTDLQPDWSDVSTLTSELDTTREPGWQWYNAERVVTGPTWGGNLEILQWNLAANHWIDDNDSYRDCVLLLETSEEMPSAEEVFRMLRNMGERGLLEQFPAVMFAKPKAWHPQRQLADTERAKFRLDQEEAAMQAFSAYRPDVMVVFGPDFGHTDPQYVLPYGGMMTIDGPSRRIIAHY